MRALLRKIKILLRDKRFRRAWRRTVTTIAAIVVFVTTYALILPAITIERQAACGIEAHQHTDDCYEEVLTCGQEESEGHTHDDSCYTVTRELVCPLEEHQHSEENGCYDEDGNLICQTQVHEHTEDCYKEARELICGLEESEGHTHTSDCYEKVLTCGKEVHTHGPECYDYSDEIETSAVAASTSAAAAEENDYEDGTVTVTPSSSDAEISVNEDSAAAATTDVLAEPLPMESLSDGYVPTLDELDMTSVLTADTGFYYFHAEEGEDIPADSADIDTWKKLKKDTTLASTDLVKAYFAYTIPAGSLNETNQVARYRLPENLHLTDDQILAINQARNNIAVSMEDDEAEYEKYLGAEAIEGTRTPDQILDDGSEEYISAVVKTENVYDEEGLYGEKGAYLGQDLIFIFSPYTIEKNQNTYDSKGNPTSVGAKVTGWFTVDFNMDQIDWIEADTDSDSDSDTDSDSDADSDSDSDSGSDYITKTADIVFSPADETNKDKEIHSVLTLKTPAEKEETADSEAANPENNDPESAVQENAAEAGTEDAAKDETEEKPAVVFLEDEEKTEKDSEEKTTDMPAQSFKKSISITTARTSDSDKKDAAAVDDDLPNKATLTVTAEADEGTFPAGTTMSVSAVTGDDLDAVNTAVENTLERKNYAFQAVDITFYDAEGNKIEPAKPIRVNMTSSAISKAAESTTTNEPVVIHIDNEGQANTVEPTLTPATDTTSNDTIGFEADSFSTYVLAYTVDFHWEVNGKTYEFSIPGGGFVSLADLVEVLGIIDDTNYEENQDEIGFVIPENAEDDTADEREEENGVNSDTNTSLLPGDVEVSEATRRFMADVASVEFSSPSLVDVSKVTESTTVGQIRKSRGLEVEYSAELTEEQIAEINAQTVEAGDWALISLQPFATEEELTVTMKNGDIWTVKVSDAFKAYYSLSGATKPEDLVGNSYVLVCSNVAVSSEALGNTGRLQGNSVTVTADTIETTANSLTEWTVTSHISGNSTYYRLSTVRNGQTYYLTLANTIGGASVSTTPQDLRIQTRTLANGQVQFKFINSNSDQNSALDLYGGSVAQGFGTYNNGEANYEHFTLYTLGEEIRPHVTVHFVDRNGNPLPGVTYSGSNTQVIKQPDEGDTVGTFTIPYAGNNANIDLSTQFSLTDYTYASTHIAGKLGDDSLTYDGVVIEPGLITNSTSNGTALYYYTRTTGSSTDTATARQTLGTVLDAPVPGDPDSSYSTVHYTTEGDQDIYVILDPKPTGYYSGEDGSDIDIGDVPDPDFDKKLTANGDGTYTISLSVTGHTSSAAFTPKANVLLIVDTSSSMRTNDASTGTSTTTRIAATKTAVTTLASTLLSYNNKEGMADDTIEMAMITFDGGVRVSQDWTSEWSTFERVINDDLDANKTHKGTDWEDAMDQALTMGKAMQNSQPDEPVYVIFFTDGEPSQYRNLHRADSYNSGSAYVYLNAYLNRETSKDEARGIVDAGMHLYGVYAFNKDNRTYGPSYDDAWADVSVPSESGQELLHNLIKYAYNTTASVENTYYYSAEKPSDLANAFNNIIKTINEYVGVSDVSVDDNITSLTSVGISTIHGDYTGFKYTRTGGQYGEEGQTWEDAPEATYNDSNGPGVHWNLADTVLEDGVTYKVSFTVWPSQEAYDWVADLNNGVRTWEELQAAGLDSHFIRIADSSTPSGYRYEVATNPPSKDEEGHILNNMVSYTKTHVETLTTLPDGVTLNTPVVETDPVTGTTVTTTYTLNEDGNYTKTEVKEAKDAFGPPDLKMDLSDTKLKVQKKWVVNRREELAAFLFNTYTGELRDDKKNIDFDILQGSATAPYTKSKYKTLELGFQRYEGSTPIFDWADEPQEVTAYGHTYLLGTIWEEPLDIAVGLMLTPAMAAERGINLADPKYIPVYASEESDTVLYYVLEKGHDYKIEEPSLDYRFDFQTEEYHPMLVDKDLRDAKITYKTVGGREIGILESITPPGERLSALSGENILRGELSVQKTVLDPEGEIDTSASAIAKVFPVKVTLRNDDPVFFNGNTPDEENVPWIGVQHAGTDHTYYYHTFLEDGTIRYVDEAEACVNGDYAQGLNEGYFGHAMTESADKKSATETIYLTANDKWTITNIPLGTTYELEESETPGYQFVMAEELEASPAHVVTDTPVITGSTMPNYTTQIMYTNQRLVTPIDVVIKKTDNVENSTNYLNGAVFKLMYRSDSSGTFTNVSNESVPELDSESQFTVPAASITLTGLVDGQYQLQEISPPSGYVITNSTPVTFTVSGGAITGTEGTITGVRYTAATETSDAEFIVPNEPGAALPSTGGPGTRLFTILGSILIAGAGVLLWRRWRTI